MSSRLTKALNHPMLVVSFKYMTGTQESADNGRFAASSASQPTEPLANPFAFGHEGSVHRSRETPTPVVGENPVFRERVAEGATAPESLRQKDRAGD